MTKVPNNYISITSGLGDANPGAILLCPLKVNDAIYGVIELASFHKFPKHQIDFVEKVCESIAATVGSVKINLRTNQLLAQTKMQAEEMASQEEELRQNMEEMQATQEEMRRRETELNEALEKVQESASEFAEKMNFYESTLNAPLNTMIYVADLSRRVIYMNNNCLQMLGKTKEEVIGKYCYDVWNVEICNTQNCAIECLKNGKPRKIDFNLGKRKLTTISSYVKDLEGNNIAFAEVIEDVTESKLNEEKLKNSLAIMQKAQTIAEEKEFEMKLIHKLIFDGLNVIEFNTEGIITDVTKSFCEIFKIEKSDIVGLPLINFLGEEAFNKVMTELEKGKVYIDTYEIQIGKNKMKVRHKFLPITDKTGELLRVLLVTFPLENQI